MRKSLTDSDSDSYCHRYGDGHNNSHRYGDADGNCNHRAAGNTNTETSPDTSASVTLAH